ncbi:GspH/FimT family pseudopilin [Thalassotalea litorea]|uniref:GspH/FimT family pseudopilin n=1 Tax=Thalassotalea litorea TaxID=2020715 RepID=UPI003735E996
MPRHKTPKPQQTQKRNRPQIIHHAKQDSYDQNYRNPTGTGDKQHGGISLVELMVVIALIMILSLIAVPGVQGIYQNQLSRTEMERWRGILQLARQSAISYQQRVTVCPSTDKAVCGGLWHQGGLVFVDKDLNHDFSHGDILIRTIHDSTKSFVLDWRSFQGTNYLQFEPSGFTNAHNGTLTICSEQSSRYHRAIIISRSGRVRIARDYDADGVYETSPGSLIDCN